MNLLLLQFSSAIYSEAATTDLSSLITTSSHWYTLQQTGKENLHLSIVLNLFNFKSMHEIHALNNLKIEYKQFSNIISHN